jgi:hypothetical protein
MEFFYDGQIRRYVTQFMRIFIGFKWQDGDGNQQQVPVLYGDMNRQVANIIKENSENKMLTVPRIACYITGLELDKSRLTDSSFVSKVNIRERRWEENNQGSRTYQQTQGGNYTVERLMPTPFKLTMKADIWTSNTDQKLQLLEQISVLFNPSLEIQTTDNYIDWTSLSVVDLDGIQFSSRNIPQGIDSEIDIASMTFEMPIWISPPAKVKKLGIIQTIITNVFTDSGDVIKLEELAFNQEKGSWGTNSTNFGVLLFKSENGQDNDYEVTVVDAGQTVLAMGLDQRSIKLGESIDWNSILEVLGGYKPGSRIYFKQPDGSEITGQFVVNSIDPSILTLSIEQGFIANTIISSSVASKGTIDAIVDPYKFNPLTRTNGRILGTRYLMLDDVNNSDSVGDSAYDGPSAWKNLDGTDPIIKANSIIEWNGNSWQTIFDPSTANDNTVIQNLKTLIKYRWDGDQWLKAFEGEYRPGSWGLILSS